MTTVYKILACHEWAAFQANGRFDGSADDMRDGFIHLSAADQVAGTAAKWFADAEGAVVAAFDVGGLGPRLRWEPSRGGALFPHYFGVLALVDVGEVVALADWVTPPPPTQIDTGRVSASRGRSG